MPLFLRIGSWIAAAIFVVVAVYGALAASGRPARRVSRWPSHRVRRRRGAARALAGLGGLFASLRGGLGLNGPAGFVPLAAALAAFVAALVVEVAGRVRQDS